MITTRLEKRTTKFNDVLLGNRFTLLHFNYGFQECVNIVISVFKTVFNTFTLIFKKLNIRRIKVYSYLCNGEQKNKCKT